jgi:8-oxo-dGTP diphosphatase
LVHHLIILAAVTPIVGASALIVRDGKILLVRRAREPYKGMWSFPGGKLEPGEGVRDTVRREVREETGLEIEVGRVAGLHDEFAVGRYVIIAFHCEVTGGELCAADDAAECAFVDLRDLPDTTPGVEDVLREAGIVR